MPLKLIPPGKRGNKHYYIRGSLKGQRVEKSTGTTDRKRAQKILDDVVLASKKQKTGSALMTFAEAAQHYSDWRSPKEPDITNIRLLRQHFGDTLIKDITQADLVGAANTLKPHCTAATKNRAVIRPAAAILHYAANNQWCEWQRIKTFREPEPKTRFVGHETEEWLRIAVKGDEEKTLILLWLFRQGDRISDILRTQYQDCDLKKRVVRRHIAKTDRTIILPLDDEICAMLAARTQKEGSIFRWKTHHGVDRWLKRLCNGLEISFTPHMARHSVGKRLSESGASLRLIMDKLGHKDSKSSLRYQRGDVESIRIISAQVLGEKMGEKI